MGTRLWWWDDNQTEQDFLKRIERFKELLSKHPRLQQDVPALAAAAIAADLHAEGAAPMGGGPLDVELRAIIEGLEEAAEEAAVQWQADGSSTEPAARRQQLLQHARSWRYLWDLPSNERLTLQHVKTAHGILMHDAIAEDGSTHFNGRFREAGAYAASTGRNSTVFAPPDAIHDELESVLSRLDVSNLASIAGFYERFLFVHPFKDGNGRLARLLVSRALKLHGLPIPTSLATLPPKASKQLMRLINRHRDGRDTTHSLLRLYLVEVIHRSWQQFSQHVGRDGVDPIDTPPPAN
ncbi:hypothetical protein ABPG77_006005 [Micractinium sp. CCAP 211/92]